MARSLLCLSIFFIALRFIEAQDVMGKIISTDALFSSAKKEAIHSHLERMLQMMPAREGLESCSPDSLTHDLKCSAHFNSGASYEAEDIKRSFSEMGATAPDCKGVDCVVAPMPSENARSGTKSLGPKDMEAAQKTMTYGPMTQDAFQRMVKRKRTAVRDDLQKKGKLSEKLENFLKASTEELQDAFGIPLPAVPLEPRPRTDFEMRFKPQVPSPDPATVPTPTSPTTTTSASSSILPSPRDDFEMRLTPQSPVVDPAVLRNELKAFIAASPVPQRVGHHTARETRTPSTLPVPEAPAPTALKASNGTSTVAVKDAASGTATAGKPAQQQVKSDVDNAKVFPSSNGPARSAMMEQDVAHQASQKATNAAARDVALERKLRIIREEQGVTGKPSKRTSTVRSNPKTARRNTSSVFQQQALQQRRRAAAAAASSAGKPVGIQRSSWGLMWSLCIMVFAVAAAVILFVAAAVFEDALNSRPGYDMKTGASIVTSALPAHWLMLTHGLWRRCRRAFTVARKQLTGHGSDLPLSMNEGCGSTARAVAAASAFVHIFWAHLRHQHQLGRAVTAAIGASRRASTSGGCSSVMSDKLSSGGAAVQVMAEAMAADCYTSPFASPHYHQKTATASSYIIEADTSASATAVLELNLRRRH